MGGGDGHEHREARITALAGRRVIFRLRRVSGLKGNSSFPLRRTAPLSVTPKMADLLGSILSSMEKPPSLGDQESRRKARGEDPKFTTAFLYSVLGNALSPPVDDAPSRTLEVSSQAPPETLRVPKRAFCPPAVLSGRRLAT
jgi:hypothetical protein